MRTVLAVMADHPVATLEIRPMPETVPRSSGILLHPVSPIATLLEDLKQEKLDDERSDLKGSAGAVKKAEAILLDRGEIGHSLGLDSAVHTIDKELSRTEDRLGKWRDALRKLPENKPVELSALKAFPGVAGNGGQFRTHLEIAALAIALKRRVIVLQAVEHAQVSEGNVFERFSRELKPDQEHIDELESGINDVLLRLSSLQIKRQSGFRSPVFTGAEVDKLMTQAYRIRSFAERVVHRDGTPDVAIDIARRRDGSVTVLPAVAVG